MRKFFSFCAGVISGSLVGAALAILLTPVSGENVRFQIQERSMRLRDDIKAVAEARRAELERELAVLRAPKKED